jgi:hypothetical protein
MIWSPSSTGRLLAGALLGAILVAGSVRAAAAADAKAPAPTPGRTALLVFLSYDGNLELSGSPTDLRLAGSRRFAAALEQRGRPVVTYPDLDTVMREWRIRSDWSLTPESFEALTDSAAADRVLVVNVLVYTDRLVALAREIDAATGYVTFSEVAEQEVDDLWTDPATTLENWNKAMDGVVARVMKTWGRDEAAGSGPILVVLPMNSVGVAQGHAELAMQCLLRSVLEAGRWSIPDPSLVRSTLRAAGFEPGGLTADARRLLATDFGAEALLLPRMVSFGQSGRANGPMLDTDDYGARDITLGPETRLPLYLSLLVVDCESGQVRTSGGEYLKPEEPLGLFGIIRDIDVSARLKRGTERLVSILREIEGDS